MTKNELNWDLSSRSREQHGGLSRTYVKWVTWPLRIEKGPSHSNAPEGISMVTSETKRASVCWSHCSAMTCHFVQPGNPGCSQSSQPPEHENSETSERSSEIVERVLSWFSSWSESAWGPLPPFLLPNRIRSQRWEKSSVIYPIGFPIDFISPTGNRTPDSRVTGGDTDHYTIEDS